MRLRHDPARARRGGPAAVGAAGRLHRGDRRPGRHGDRRGPLPAAARTGRAVALSRRGLPDVGGGGGRQGVRGGGRAADGHVASRAARADREADQELASGPARAARAGRRGRDVPGQDLHLTAGAAVAAQPDHRARRRHPRDEPGARVGGQYGPAGRGAALPSADRNRGKRSPNGPGRERNRPGRERNRRERNRRERRRPDRGGRRVRAADARLRLRRRGHLQSSRGRDRRTAQPPHVLALPPDDRRAPEAGRNRPGALLTCRSPAPPPDGPAASRWPGRWRSSSARRPRRSCRCRTRRTWPRCSTRSRPGRTPPCRRARPR